jgi:ribosomal protein S18 acetylase RimI-like enzyme
MSASVHPLDAPIWGALVGPQAGFAEVSTGGRAVRFAPDVAPFAALADRSDPSAWDDLAGLVGPRGRAVVFVVPAGAGRPDPWPPRGWSVEFDFPGVQMAAESVDPSPDAEAVPLGAADVPEMLDLVARTRPGPFLDRTVELGGYLGIRRHGRLVAMAGQRLRPTGHTEISAVCTDADHRGRGLGARLVRAVAAGAVQRDERPFLHASATNVHAIRLYQALGLRVRCEVSFVALTAPT